LDGTIQFPPTKHTISMFSVSCYPLYILINKTRLDAKIKIVICNR
jgi:hypothetical protein